MPALTPPPAEVAISPGLVRTLLAEQHPDLADREIAEPLEGFAMAVLRLGDDLAVRLPRHRHAVGALAAEVRWVPRLQRGWTFVTQRVHRTGTPGDAFPWPWAVTSWLPGRLAADDPLDAAAAPALGRALAQVHRPAAVDAPFNDEQSIPLADRGHVLEAVLPLLAEVARRDGRRLDTGAVRDVWREALAVPDDAPRVWLHADLHPFNVISADGAFGGIIDWSDVCGGDPAVDLGFLWLLLPADAVRQAYDAYARVDDATAARARGIGLVKAATLAVVPEPRVAAVGWRALVELGVTARP